MRGRRQGWKRSLFVVYESCKANSVFTIFLACSRFYDNFLFFLFFTSFSGVSNSLWYKIKELMLVSFTVFGVRNISLIFCYYMFARSYTKLNETGIQRSFYLFLHSYSRLHIHAHFIEKYYSANDSPMLVFRYSYYKKIELAVMVRFKFEHTSKKKNTQKKVTTTTMMQLNAKICSHAHSIFLMYCII